MVLSLSCHGQSQVGIVIGSDGQALGIIKQLLLLQYLGKEKFPIIYFCAAMDGGGQATPLAPGGQPHH